MSATAFQEQSWVFLFFEINIFFPLCSSIPFLLKKKIAEVLEFYYRKYF